VDGRHASDDFDEATGVPTENGVCDESTDVPAAEMILMAGHRSQRLRLQRAAQVAMNGFEIVLADDLCAAVRQVGRVPRRRPATAVIPSDYKGTPDSAGGVQGTKFEPSLPVRDILSEVPPSSPRPVPTSLGRGSRHIQRQEIGRVVAVRRGPVNTAFAADRERLKRRGASATAGCGPRE